jgi:hypothetical protein
VFTALIVVLNLLGTFVDILDFTTAAISSFAVLIVMLEAKKKYAFMVYAASGILSVLLVPMSTATLYYIAFFGFYPILRAFTSKFAKILRKTICFVCFNLLMAGIMLLFKAVFALQNEPYYIYLILLAALNIFFFAFDRLYDVFPILYVKLIRNKIKFML